MLRIQFPWSAYPSSLACKRWVTHALVLPICIYDTSEPTCSGGEQVCRHSLDDCMQQIDLPVRCGLYC